MGAWDYASLREHIGHKIACVCYGKDGQDPQNVAIECETCDTVLLDYDKPSEKQRGKRRPKRKNPLHQLAR